MSILSRYFASSISMRETAKRRDSTSLGVNGISIRHWKSCVFFLIALTFVSYLFSLAPESQYQGKSVPRWTEEIHNYRLICEGYDKTGRFTWWRMADYAAQPALLDGDPHAMGVLHRL